MDSSPDAFQNIELDGLSVRVELGYQAASLRFFDVTTQFAVVVSETLGRPLAEPLRAVRIEQTSGGAYFILAWRSPTENLLLCSDRAAFFAFATKLSVASDGCLVDQSGGIRVIRVAGRRARDLLLRLGGSTALPELGEARTGRLAELSVQAVSVEKGEYLLLVERVYAPHLLAWINATAADM
jgi:sarcosine oxidase gamma subunit